MGCCGSKSDKGGDIEFTAIKDGSSSESPSRKTSGHKGKVKKKSVKELLAEAPTTHSPARNSLLPPTVMDDKQMKVEYEEVKLTEAEEAEVAEAYKHVSAHFSWHELGQLYVGYKQNGKQIGRDEFSMVYSSFSKLANEAMVDAVFELFDTNHDGKFSFSDFIEFFSAITHGEMKQRAKYCFQLYDHDKDGKLTRDDLVSVLAKMPVEQFVSRKLAVGAKEELQLSQIQEEDEEEEEEEQAAAAVGKGKAAKQEKKKSGKTKGSGKHKDQAEETGEAGNAASEQQKPPASADDGAPADDGKNKTEKRKSLYNEEELAAQRMLIAAMMGTGAAAQEKQKEKEQEVLTPDAERNQLLAKDLVDHIFSEVAHAETGVITLEEWIASVEESETMHTIFPI